MAVTTDQVVEFVRARVLVPSARRDDVLKALEYYQGDQAKHIPPNRDESDAHFAGRPKYPLNVTRKVMDTKACLYDEGCVRASPDADVTRFWAETGIDERMKEADPVIALVGTVFVFPDYVVPSRRFWLRLKAWAFALARGRLPAEDGRYIWRAYTPNHVEVMLDPEYPELPALLCVFETVEVGGEDATLTQAWSAEGYWRLLGDVVDVGEPHGFGRIPFVKLAHKPDWLADFWGLGEWGNVVPQNQEINRLNSSLQWLVVNQAHGQWVGENLPAGWTPTMGTDQVVLIDDSDPDRKATLKLVAPVANVDGLKAAIDWHLDKLCEMNDIAAGTYRLDVNRQSGASLEVKQVATHRFRKRRRPQALVWEAELAAMARIAKAARTGGEVPAGRPEISVNYREPDEPQDTAARVQREEHELRSAQATVPELLMRHDPDLTREAAEERHRANLEYNRGVGGAELEGEGEGAGSSPEALAAAVAALAAAGEPGQTGQTGRTGPTDRVELEGPQKLWGGKETLE